jgi:hypothetical protein
LPDESRKIEQPIRLRWNSPELMEYPKTVVLYIGSHGMLPLDANNNPIPLKIPKKMKFTNIAHASFGSIAYIRLDKPYNDEFIEKIKKSLKINSVKRRLEYNSQPYEHTQDNLRPLLNVLQNFTNAASYNLQTRSQYYYAPYAIDDYIHTCDNFNTCQSTAYNKLFTTDDDVYKYPNQPYMGGITILNMESYPDVYKILKTPTGVSLQEIINYLHKRRVTQIICIDMSCSVFVLMAPRRLETNNRNIRTLRRNMLKACV